MVDAQLQKFCRDCLVETHRPGASRCGACGSPRILSYKPSPRLTIAHLDCDAFYASVEKRDRPDLRDRPVIVGGGTRGVVATACYIARIRGVRSAMPMFKALKLCPEAVVVRPDMEKYATVARQVRRMMTALTPLVEPISIDEAFLDLAGTERLHAEPAAMTLARLARAIERDLEITVSIGLSYNKFLAKVASDLGKPRGFSIIEEDAALAFLRDKPITLIWGVGKTLDQTLQRDGLRTIGQLQAMDEADLMKRYGQMGQRLSRLSRGIDGRGVSPRETAKSISAETTFDADYAAAADLLPPLRRLCERVSHRLKATDLAAQTVVVKLKTTDFRTRTRRMRLPSPTRLADRLFVAARQLLEKEVDGTKFRLIGVGCVDFHPASAADPLDLVDPGVVKRAHAEAALDRLRRRFGHDAIETGYTFGKNAARRSKARHGGEHPADKLDPPAPLPRA